MTARVGEGGRIARLIRRPVAERVRVRDHQDRDVELGLELAGHRQAFGGRAAEHDDGVRPVHAERIHVDEQLKGDDQPQQEASDGEGEHPAGGGIHRGDGRRHG